MYEIKKQVVGTCYYCLVLAISGLGFVIYNQIENKLVMTMIKDQMNSQLDNLTESITTRRAVEKTFFETLDEKNLDLTEAVAEIINYSPTTLTREDMMSIAKSINVDKIHVVDEAGILKNGNIEGFIGFDFNTSVQTLPFLNLIGKEDGRLVQKPSERGADKVLFQYIGVTRKDAPGLVQIGLSPEYIDDLQKVIGLQSMIDGLKVGKSGYAYIIDSNEKTIYHKNPENV